MALHPFMTFLYHKWLDSGTRWYPFIAAYYLTYACDFRCPYCANGANIPYHRLPDSAMSGQSALCILERIRRHAARLILTGGEPLMHPDAGEVIRGIGALDFRSVVLTTNGERLSAFLPDIANNVTDLVVSLDTLDAHKADAWYGKGVGTLDRILANIELAVQFRAALKRPFTLTLSAVVTPNNIEDIYRVYAYAQQRGCWFSASPELQGVSPPEKLRANSAYRNFFDFLIAEKRQGRDIFGSRQYLEHLRDFRSFVCHPLTMLAVSPQGEVFFPCLEKAHIAGNILTDDLHHLRVKARQALKTDTQPCLFSCPSPCALSLSLCIERPGSDFAGAIAQAWRARRASKPGEKQNLEKPQNPFDRKE
jgi:MoaA/NifB/PqqE/SkfB family radical SAM enzyme